MLLRLAHPFTESPSCFVSCRLTSRASPHCVPHSHGATDSRRFWCSELPEVPACLATTRPQSPFPFPFFFFKSQFITCLDVRFLFCGPLPVCWICTPLWMSIHRRSISLLLGLSLSRISQWCRFDSSGCLSTSVFSVHWAIQLALLLAGYYPERSLFYASHLCDSDATLYFRRSDPLDVLACLTGCRPLPSASPFFAFRGAETFDSFRRQSQLFILS